MSKYTIDYIDIDYKEFTEHVNDAIHNIKPIYSQSDIISSLRYASKQISIDPSEVGKQTYDMLFSEKVEEYLHKLLTPRY